MPRSISFFSKVSFFNFLCAQNASSLETAIHHPFNKQLFSGALDPEVFNSYLHDDFIYLNEYSQVLKKLVHDAQKTSFHASFKTLQDIADEIIRGEQDLRDHFKVQSHHEVGDAISNYIHFLRDCSQKTLPVALASIVPCFWIYSRIGEECKITTSNTAYIAWINTYTDPSFQEATGKVIKLMNQLTETATEQEKKEMEEVFSQAIAHECHFFDEIMTKVPSLSFSAA